MKGSDIKASGVILAAGRGKRLGLPINKALVELFGKSLLRRSAEALVGSGILAELVVVVRPDDLERARAELEHIPLPLKVVGGGERRQDSSLAGVEAAGGDYVLIHDAARALVSPSLAKRVLKAAVEHGAAIPAIPVRDTIRYVVRGFARPGPKREGLHLVQTPQGFERGLILRALKEARRRDVRITDDAEAVLLLGEPVAVVEGEATNLKITYPEDLTLAEAILSLRPGGQDPGHDPL